MLLGLVCAFNAHLFSTAPFAESYVFDGPSGVFQGQSGNTYVIDRARKDVLILNDDMEYIRTIEGGKTGEDTFYYATAVADTPDGIYVVDTLYAGTGTIIQSERLWRFEPDGTGGEVVWQLDYPDADTAPRQYGRIKTLTAVEGQLSFTAVEDRWARVYRYEPDTGAVNWIDYDFGSCYLLFAAPHPVTGLPAVIAGDTTIRVAEADGSASTLARTDAVPYQLAVTSDGTVWFSEQNSGALMRVGDSGQIEFVTDEVYANYVSSMGNTLCISDGLGIALYEGGEMIYLTEVSIANGTLRSFMWCLLALCAAGLVALLILAGRAVIRSWLGYPFFRKIAAVLIAAVTASSIASWYLLTTTFEEENNRTMTQLETMADQIVRETDIALLEQLTVPSDYRSDSFNAVKGRLDAVIDEGYRKGEYFYYLTYITDGELIYGIMDYEDTVRPGMAYDVYGAEGYTDVFETGEPILVEGEVSTWGAWTLLLNPVFDDDGRVAAIQEVGFNYDSQLLAQRETVVNTVLTIVFGAIVLVMLIIECIYFQENRKEFRALLNCPKFQIELCDRLPLRTLTFLAFTVDCMQDAFISILTTNLYVPVWGIPQSVGAALPISGQVLMAAVFAVIGGFLTGRIGKGKVIRMGFVLHAAGFALCGATLSYSGILLGKLLVGAGMGLIAVGINATAAGARDPEKRVKLFAGISAGTLVGVSAGSGLGSTILSLAGYRTVFFVGTAILALGFLLSMSGRETDSPGVTREEQGSGQEGGSSMGLGRFLVGRGGTLPFLAMVLSPFMVAIYFREYFFPVFSAENGLSETNIGRIYVLCALLVIYAGPAITRTLHQGIGALRTVLLTSAVISLATLSFAFLPNMAGALLGVLLVSVAVSCGYAAQSSYYASLPAVSALGEGRAMGIYSLFDNGGQTLGPIVYGGAMLLGYQMGMLCVGGALALLTGAFGVLRRRELGEKTIQKLQEEEIC